MSELDWDTLVCFTQGLVEVAKVDGIQPKEKEYIEAFFDEEVENLKESKEFHFEDFLNNSFDINTAKNFIKTDELKDFFLKSCVMLACVDTFSTDEKELIKRFANALNVSDEKYDALIKEVQDEILAQFKNISIYTDSLKDVAKSIGVEF